MTYIHFVTTIVTENPFLRCLPSSLVRNCELMPDKRFLLVIATFIVSALLPSPAYAADSTMFDYILVISAENHGLNEVFPAMPYMTSLANTYGLSTQYTTSIVPSLPNYLALFSGQTWGCDGYDGLPNSNNCTDKAWNSTNANLVDRLEAKGITWKAYMEDMPSNCYTDNIGNYAVRHNPFVYFSDIATNQSRCEKVVPAGVNDITLLNDLRSTETASNFMWLTPNLCNGMHDCSVGTGDKYLSELVPKILSSNVFMTQKAVIFLFFDEPGSGGSQIYAAWVGPAAKKAYQSAKSYTHYSFLKTVEANWGLPNITSNDGNALAMTEFFGDNHNYEVTVS
ncbi:hypothetical protein EPN87_02080, partial [archaeon]